MISPFSARNASRTLVIRLANLGLAGDPASIARVKMQNLQAADCGRMLVTKSRIALRPRISSLSPPARLSGVRRVAAFLAHGTRVRSFHSHVLSFQQIRPRSGASAGSEVAEF